MTQTVFSIDKLRTKIGGFAKGNRYNVTFSSLPTGLSTTVNENLQYFNRKLNNISHDRKNNDNDNHENPQTFNI